MLPANLQRQHAQRAAMGMLFARADVFQVDVDTFTGHAQMRTANAYASRDPIIITNAIMSAVRGVRADRGAHYPNRDFSLQASLSLQNDTTVRILDGMRVPYDQPHVTLWNRVHAAVMINLGALRTGAQSGDTDYDELFWWNSVLVRLAYRQPRVGGCDSFSHTRVFKSEDGELKLSTRSIKSKDDNCALACIIQMMRKIETYNPNAFPGGRAKSAKMLRTVCKIPAGPITVQEFGTVCDHYKLSYIIYDGSFDMVARKPTVLAEKENEYERLEVLLFDHHYYQVQHFKDENELEFCEDCRVSYKKKKNAHSCTARCIDCGHVKRPGHKCAMNIAPPPPPAPCVPHAPRAPAAPIAPLQGVANPPPRDTVDCGASVFADSAMSTDVIIANITNALEAGRHALIHGPGGCGKSYIIEHVMRALCARGLTVQCVAPTATAALLIGGATTFHRYFKVNPKNRQFGNACLDLDCLIIDEFSMLGANLFTSLDRHLRKTRKSALPFGGVAILFSGDIMQLQPVKDEFLVMTPSWHSIDAGMLVYHLDKMYRFKDDPAWGEALKKIRIGVISDEIREILERRLTEEPSFDDVHFYPRRNAVDVLNREYLNSLPGELLKYPLPFGSVKIGARVMMTHNSQIVDGISNGSCGVLMHVLTDPTTSRVDSALVRFDGDKVINVKRTPEEPDSKKKILPLVIARAMTIHKAQGATVSKMCVNIGDCFTAGQAYVGLSRVRTRAGLEIIGSIPSRLAVDRYSIRFDAWTRKCSTLDVHDHYLRDDEVKSCAAVASSEEEQQRLVTLREARGDGVYEIVSSPYADAECKDLDIDDQIMVVSRAKSTRRVFKAIFFDFETYPSARNGGRHVVYAVHARFVLYDAGDRQKKRPCTCKTLERYTRWLTAEESMETHGNDIVAFEFFDWVMKKVSEHEIQLANSYRAVNMASKIFLCAYNGNKFDLFWFARYILQRENFATNYNTALTSRGSNGIVSLVLTSAVCGKPILATHDIYDIIHMSLAQAVGCYGKDIDHVAFEEEGVELESQADIEKDVFPHVFMTDDTYPDFANGVAQCVRLDEFPKTSRKKVRELMASGELDIENFKLRAHCEEYLQKDVDALCNVYMGFDKICRKYADGPSVFNFCTMAQLTWYCYLRNLEPKHVAYQKFDKKKDVRHIVSKIFRLTREDDEFVAQSIFGGCVFPRIKEFESKDLGKSYDEIEDYLVDFDLCSMYVHIMIKFEFPMGEHRWGIDVDKARYLDAILKGDVSKLEFAILEVEFRFVFDELHPAVPHRHHKTKQLLWANCAVDDPEDPTCTTYDKGNFIRGIYTSVDIQNMIKSKAEFKPVIHRLLFWPEKGRVLKKWVEKTFQMKLDADKNKKIANAEIAEAKKTMAEGPARDKYIQEREDTLVKCASLRQFGKTMGNALYGSTAKRDHNSTFALIQNNEEMEDFMNNYTWTDATNIERYQQGIDEILVLHGEPLVSDTNIMCSRPRYLGAFVLSYTRQMIGKLVNLINPRCRGGGEAGVKMQPFYGDTDSLFAHASSIPRLMSEIGEAHGKLTDDMYDGWNKGTQKNGVTPLFAKIVEGRFLRPKEYAVKGVLVDETVKSTIKLKGIPSAKFGDIEVSWMDGENGLASANEVTYDLLKRCEVLRRDVLRMKDEGATREDCDAYFAGLSIKSAGRLNKCGLRLSKSARMSGNSLFTINNADMTRCIFKGQWEGRKFYNGSETHLVPHGYGYKCEEQSDEPAAKRMRL